MNLRRRTPLGWRQLSHQPSRLLVALAGVAFADILIFTQLGFQGALYNSATRLHRSLNADIILINPQALNLTQPSTFPRRRLSQAKSIDGVESAEPLYVNLGTWKNPETRENATLLILGFKPDQPVFDRSDVNQNLHLLKVPDTVLFDQAARGQYQTTIQQVQNQQPVTTELERRTVRIKGLYAVGASFGADGSLMMSDQTFLNLYPRRQASSVSIGLIEVKPGYDPQQVTAVLKSILPNDVLVLTKAEFIAFEENYWTHHTAVGFVFGLGTVMGFVVGVIIVYQVLTTDVNDHLAEYATFKAMGYRYRYFLGVIFEEAIILAVLGFIPGITVTLGIYNLAHHATNLPIYMTSLRAIQVFILTLIMCVVSGTLTSRKLQAADPADLF